jgi:biopolymer transport protein ExbD
MARVDPQEYHRHLPNIPLTALIDIVFLTLVFFMMLAVYSQIEADISVSVPKTQVAQQTLRSPGEIIINVTREGQFLVNQQSLDLSELENMLKKVAKMFPDQPVIIRADERAYHKYVISVLDACARANIWDVSFSATADSR